MMKQLSIYISIVLIVSCNPKDSADKKRKGENQWTQDATAHFRLKAQGGVRSAGKLKAIGEKMEVIQQELLAMLNETERQRLLVYFLKDRETLASYTGFPAKGYTDTKNGIIYFVDRDPFHVALRHETMHALSWRLWGPPNSYWLSEGLAVYASGTCGNYHLHALAHALNKQGKIISFKNLTENFDFRALEPSLQAASMVKFIYENYGVSALKHFWQSKGGNSVPGMGVSAGELERKWKRHIEQAQFNSEVDFNRIKENGCE